MLAEARRELAVGSIGWMESDLDEPEIALQWEHGRFELINGVIARMPPAFFAGQSTLDRLADLIKVHTRADGSRWSYAAEIDIVIDETRVLVADGVFLTPAQKGSQLRAARLAKPNLDPSGVRILIPPILVIESVSPGHERHDRILKRAWYAEFGVQHYWILDYFSRSLECLNLVDKIYQRDALGTENDVLVLPSLPGLSIPLAEIWPE